MSKKPLILISLLLAAFVINLDTTIVNVALPTLVRELHASELAAAVGRGRVQPAVRRARCSPPAACPTASGARGCCSPAWSVFGLASLAGGLTDSRRPR